MKERRRATRHRCRLRAEILRGAERLEALLLDVSLSGLSLQAGIALAQGDPVEVTLEGGARSRVVTLAALTKEAAVAGSLAEVGPDWEVLDVVPAS